MKKLIALFILPLALFGAAGDIKISYKSSNDISWVDAIFATQNSMILGTSSSGVPGFATAGVLNLNAVALSAGLSGTQLQLGQVDGTNTRLTLDGFGAATIIDGRRAAGTNASKGPLLTGAIMLRVGGVGYGSSYTTGERAFINFTASENWSNTLQGAIVEIGTTPTGSTTTSVTSTFTSTGLQSAIGATTPSTGAFTTVSASGVVTINQATLTNPTAVADTLFHVTGPDTHAVVTLIDAFGGNPASRGRRAEGTSASPTAVTSGAVLYSLGGIGYGATGYSASATGVISVIANQNFTDSAQGTRFLFETTPDGSTTRATALTIGADKSLTLAGSLIVPTSTPASAAAAGVAGTITWDASYIYVCIATNTWKRAAITTW